MITVYPLEWIDSLILHTLDSKKTNISDLSQSDLAFIGNNLSKELHLIQVQLKNEIFSLQKKRQIRLLVRKYHSSLVYLLDKVIGYQKKDIVFTGVLAGIMELVINCLYDLLSFVQSRYFNYLSLDEHVPVQYLVISRKEIFLRLETLKNKEEEGALDGHLTEMVFNAISSSIAEKPQHKITYREILYQKELLKYLEVLAAAKDQSTFYSGIDQLLMEMNFNYHPYIGHFTRRIQSQLDLQESLVDKTNQLLVCYKEFSQLLFNEKISFDPTRENIRYVLDNWFRQEITYLERKLVLDAGAQSIHKEDQNMQIGNNKVQCALSTDQMGLILRAGDEARILKAKSLNEVFRTIVPHLSTALKKNLSYNSMRSKSYSAEEKDKQIAIQTLERMIKHIREF
ncbi:hypothetical protein ACQKCJ_22395 [Flavobacterium sp. NPDC079362]|uniref:hypothetical protein n=1 Tax=Flavobacterium sp. NPDC079362 TaxID=3390566 RepID=UPI003CFFAD15